MLGSLLNSKNSPKITQDGESGRAKNSGVPIQISGADTIKRNENIYELTPELYKALSDAGYIGKTMKTERYILMLNNKIRDLGYTGVDDRYSKRKIFFTKTLPKLVNDISKLNFRRKYRQL